ncbi:MAG: glycosyltransferase family 2 protein [bacterium]
MISVVIPAYNEQEAIAPLIERLREKLAPVQGYEIIIVDDGSTDKTAAIAGECGAIVVRHPHNAGYGRSLKDGIAAAGNDTIVILDADGTYSPGDLYLLLAEYEKGFDLIIGRRSGRHYSGTWYKSPLRSMLKLLVEFTVGARVPDINSGYRVFSKKTIMPYMKYLCDTFSFTTSMTLSYMLDCKYVSYVDIAYDKRIGKSKVRLFKDSLRTLQYIVQAILHFNPLKLYLVLCAFVSVMFFVFAGLAIGFKSPACMIVSSMSLLTMFIIFAIGLHATLELKK